MADSEVVETEHMADGAEAPATEPEDMGAIDETPLEPGAEEAAPEPEAEKPIEPPDDLRRELEELRAEKQRMAPLIEFAQHALRARAQQPTPQPQVPTGPNPVDEAFRLLWEPAATDEQRTEREAAFKALPSHVRNQAVQRFNEAQQQELERARDPQGYYQRMVGSLVQRAVQEALAPMRAETMFSRFDASYPDLANEAGYGEVAAEMEAGLPLPKAVELVRFRRAAAQAAAGEKSRTAAAADSRAVREARQGRAEARPNRAGSEKPIKRSGFSYEDAVRDVNRSLSGEE